MATLKIKAGTNLSLPLEIVDNKFAMIEAIEFLFKQTESGETLKTAYWSRDGESRDAVLIDGTQKIAVRFSREDTYLFQQDETFFIDTRIHYTDTDENPYTPILRLRMNMTLFSEGEEVTA